MPIPQDYLERVYAGVLGKLIGVYLGRPFEGWTHQRIMEELGPIEYYVNERLNQPLVVTDDDVGGTFTFIRALEDYGVSAGLSAEEVGKAWLNYIVEGRSIFWWGGRGNSTEHTAYLNLKEGIPAPRSGSIAMNGKTVAEQIGAQIFIDGWAMVAPGQPALAAMLAEQAGKVSHDGESVHAAKLWAAMEAEAFNSSDIDHLIETGLTQIPVDCLVARMIADVRSWRATFSDWREARRQIESDYGYEKFPGYCHVIPNHALMIMAVLYAPHDFQRAQMIVNTSGWDTDCNAGNVGCLLGIMNGLAGLDEGPDWRGPIADRMLISSADGGNSINDAVRQAYYLASLGRRLAGLAPLEAPKAGAQFHFSLPGSLQGFQGHRKEETKLRVGLANLEYDGGRALAIDYDEFDGVKTATVTTPTFSPRDMLNMRTYDLVATPLVYSGQTTTARIIAAAGNRGAVEVRLLIRYYGANDELFDIYGSAASLRPGAETILEWAIPDLRGQPIAEIGIALGGKERPAGRILLDYLRWDGAPVLNLTRPEEGCDFWRLAWVNGVSIFSKRYPPASFRISQNSGEGIILHGTRQWTNYQVDSEITLHLGTYGGLAVRAQGLRRYYGARVTRDGQMQIVRVRDEETKVLVEAPFKTEFDQPITMRVVARGDTIGFTANGQFISVTDSGNKALRDGAIGLVVHDGALSTNEIHVAAG